MEIKAESSAPSSGRYLIGSQLKSIILSLAILIAEKSVPVDGCCKTSFLSEPSCVSIVEMNASREILPYSDMSDILNSTRFQIHCASLVQVEILKNIRYL